MINVCVMHVAWSDNSRPWSMVVKKIDSLAIKRSFTLARRQSNRPLIVKDHWPPPCVRNTNKIW